MRRSWPSAISSMIFRTSFVSLLRKSTAKQVYMGKPHNHRRRCKQELCALSSRSASFLCVELVFSSS